MTANDDGKTVPGKPLPPASRSHSGARAIHNTHTVDSRDLLAGQSSVQIEHMGEIYRLQTTRQGKLILTK